MKSHHWFPLSLFATVGLVISSHLLPAASLATGSVPLLESFTTANTFDFGGNATIGYSFISSPEPVSVTELGMWDSGADGFASDVEVGLYSASGSILGQVFIGAGTGDPLEDGFRYVTLSSPITLLPSTSYVIGAYRVQGVPYSAVGTIEGSAFVTSSGFDVVESRASSENGGEGVLSFPAHVFVADQALVGPNMKFQVVPEPSHGFLAMLGGLACAFGRRRTPRRK